MTPARHTFRGFINSTSSDPNEERDALQNRVFIKPRLRWGVREVAAFDHETMNICLQEFEQSGYH